MSPGWLEVTHRVYAVQFLGIFGAATTILLLAAASLKITKILHWESREWPLVLGCFFPGICSLLSIESMVRAPALTWIGISLICGGGLLGLRRLKVSKVSTLGKFALVALAIDLLYAGFPAYRSDQWTYSLVVAKIISQLGPITEPILEDHHVMTGFYEYFFLIPRIFSQNDVFNHCFANAFSWSMLVILILGALQYLEFAAAFLIPLTAWALFSLPEHEAIINTKPDFILAPWALLLFALMTKEHMRRRDGILLGFFLVAPLGFKQTWAHAALCFAGTFIIWNFRKLRDQPLREIAAGMAAGLVAVLPVWIKNARFLGNPLHPMQTPLFHSKFWSASYATFWQTVADRPKNFQEALETPFLALFHLFDVAQWLLLPLGILSIFVYMQKKLPAPLRTAAQKLRPAGIFIVILLLSWPLFYGAHPYPRFLGPVYGVLIYGVSLLVTAVESVWVLPAVVAAPILMNSSLDVRLARMFPHETLEIADHFERSPPPLDIYRHFMQINSHIRENYPNAGYGDVTVLADTFHRYFLNAQTIEVDDYSYEILQTVYFPGKCVAEILKTLRARYAVSYNKPFSAWPDPYLRLFAKAERLSPNIFHIPESAIDALVQDDPTCRHDG